MKIIKSSELGKDFYLFKSTEILPAVHEVLNEVKAHGDRAVKKYTEKFDKVSLDNFKVSKEEIKTAYSQIDVKLIEAIKKAAENIRIFAGKQLGSFKDFEYEISEGVVTGQKIVPIQRVGVYVPGGRFPLISTVLMCSVPAQVANVDEIAVFSPPTYNGSIHPAILAAADIIGIKEIYKIGGVQAVGAMAYGTETIKPVDKIVGPGNKYVALAKKEVYGIVGIDFIAGPTEVLIIADETANEKYIAADLLAQAEHDPDAQPILVTISEKFAKEVAAEVDNQLKDLSTKAIAEISIKNNGLIIIAKDLNEAAEISNKRAPEHLELEINDTDALIPKLRNYGSLFIGAYSAEALGDYSSGLNHTLPTNFASRYTGGLSVKDFIKIQTTLRGTKEGIKEISEIAGILADAEGLTGHAKSVRVRNNCDLL
jgi:histidinol dehydrogenase